MVKERWIDVFARVGKQLASFGNDDASRRVMAQAVEQNPWFTEKSILLAVTALREKMLSREALSEWLAQYDLSQATDRGKLGIIMAGNIPLVGFFDLMCGVVCGYECMVKPSGKDTSLMRYLIDLLKEIAPHIPITIGLEEQPDMLIATGSDNTISLIRHQYGDIPTLLRGSRSSVAILSGPENDKELALLAEDIFSYSGLGCRNVSLLFVPVGYDIEKMARVFTVCPDINPKYRRNYLQNKALCTMHGVEFTDGGFFTLRPGDDFPLSISEIIYCEYETPQQVRQWLALHDGQLQCVVGATGIVAGEVPFGRAQFPALEDYPDRCDVIRFLLGGAVAQEEKNS